ncbi:MAG: cytochrome P450 [Chloroflexota bacterium]|nr:cytochrome P450 [Chloroflexota bacterium]
MPEPVKDWTTDYDIFDPSYKKDPFPVWDEIREKCPVATTDRWGGSFMPTRYEDLFNIAKDITHFSSRNILVTDFEPPSEDQEYEVMEEVNTAAQYNGGAPPITSDPPVHTWARKLLLPPFTATAIAKWEPETRRLCGELIDGFLANGKADGAVDYAQQIPPRVIADMLGIPKEMAGTFTEWVRGFLELGLTDADLRQSSAISIFTYMNERIQERKANLQEDDLLSYLLSATVDGEPVPEPHVLGTCFLLMVAGIDTTWSSIGSAIWHLAQHPKDCARLIAEPELIDSAIEELLRAYSPVTMARYVAADVEYAGCPMHEGDKVLMNFPAANRDPKVFENPDEVILDRAKNPHIAFGVGIHRCAGSNLARMEMKVAVEEWLKRIPSFRLEDPEKVTWAGGQVRGPRLMPVVWPA